MGLIGERARCYRAGCGAHGGLRLQLHIGMALLAAMLWLIGASVAAGANGAQVCDAAALDGARTHDVPVDILRALTRTETGRAKDGTLNPWPWTVNMEGAGFWFDTRAEALSFVQEHHARGARSFDIGCFQINFRWHGEAFSSLDAMFDPVTNARYAAQFIAELKSEGRDWTGAAGAYHSRTPSFADKYKSRFARILSQLGPMADDGGPETLTAMASARALSGAAGSHMPGGVFASGPAHPNPDQPRLASRGGVRLTMFVPLAGGILTAGSRLIGAQ